MKEKPIPRGDWIVVPLLGLLTIAVIAGAAGLSAERLFGASGGGFNQCLQVTDPALGMHGKPNTTCVFSGHETDLVQYKFNNCGYRMDVDCGPPQPGAYRIVMIGSSVALGTWIPREKSIAALLQQALSRDRGRIEVYNEGMMCEYPQVAAARFSEVLAAKPKMVLWVVSPFDLGVVTLDPKSTVDPDVTAIQPLKKTESVSTWTRWWTRIRSGESLASTAREAWQKEVKKFLDSSTGVMLLHCLYENQTRYVHSFLQGPDSDMGFLRAAPSRYWSKNFMQFNNVAAKIANQAKAAGVPLVVVLAPARAQAAMISMGEWPDLFDPYKIGAEVSKAVENSGETYIDILSSFRSIQNAGDFYLPVDGHPNIEGHSLLSTLMAKGILGRNLLPSESQARARRLAATGN